MKIPRLILLLSLLCALSACERNDLSTARVQNITGLRLYEKKDYKKALYFFMKAAAHENLPDTIKAMYFENIAHCYSQTLQPDSARLFYSKAARFYNPASYNYKISMANLFLIDARIDSALLMLKEGYQIDSNSGTVNNLWV